jgi:hypothetical protein
MKKYILVIALFAILFFINGCYEYEDSMSITIVNNSSYDLHIKFQMKQKQSQYTGNLIKGESDTFNVIFSGTAVIVVPVDRFDFHALNDHIEKVSLFNLDTSELLKEMRSIESEFISADHSTRGYTVEITDDLLL